MEVSRYIHLNPLRTRPPLCARPENWRWSSYRGYHRAAVRLDWVDYARVLREFGGDRVRAARSYRRFIEAGIQEGPRRPWADAVHGLIVGSETFVDRIRSILGDAADPELPQARGLAAPPDLEAILSAVGAVFDVPVDRWQRGRRIDDASRCVGAYVARRYGHRAKDIAVAFGYAGSSGVAQAVRRVEQDAGGLDPAVKKVQRKLAR